MKFMKPNMQCLFIMLAASLVLFISSACEKKIEEDSAHNIHKDSIDNAQNTGKQEKSGKEAFVIEGGDYTINMEEYDRCVKSYTIIGEKPSQRALANVRFQRDEARRCVQRKFLREYAKVRNINVTDEELAVAEKHYLEHHGLATRQELARKLEMTDEEVLEVLRDSILPRKIYHYTVDNISREDKMAQYKNDFALVEMEWLNCPNTASKEEIEDYLKNHLKDIMAFYQREVMRYFTQPRVKFIEFTFPFQNDADRERVFQVAMNFRSQIATASPEKAQETCNTQTGCQCTHSVDAPLDQERSSSNVWAFRTAVGGVSEVDKDGNAFKVYKTIAFADPVQKPMTDELKAEVAGDFLRENVPSVSIMETLKGILPNAGLNFEKTENTPANIAGCVYSHAEKAQLYRMKRAPLFLPETVAMQVSLMKDDLVGLISDPVLDNGNIYVYRVISRQSMTDEDYAQNEASFIQYLKDQSSADMINGLIKNNLPTVYTLNLRVIQEKYGLLQQDGTIHF